VASYSLIFSEYSADSMSATSRRSRADGDEVVDDEVAEVVQVATNGRTPFDCDAYRGIGILISIKILKA
jgi:hypothetical protein